MVNGQKDTTNTRANCKYRCLYRKEKKKNRVNQKWNWKNGSLKLGHDRFTERLIVTSIHVSISFPISEGIVLRCLPFQSSKKPSRVEFAVLVSTEVARSRGARWTAAPLLLPLVAKRERYEEETSRGEESKSGEGEAVE